jgi:hypothetical protein
MLRSRRSSQRWAFPHRPAASPLRPGPWSCTMATTRLCTSTGTFTGLRLITSMPAMPISNARPTPGPWPCLILVGADGRSPNRTGLHVHHPPANRNAGRVPRLAPALCSPLSRHASAGRDRVQPDDVSDRTRRADVIGPDEAKRGEVQPAPECQPGSGTRAHARSTRAA